MERTDPKARKDCVTTATAPPNSPRQLPPVLGRLVSGTIWTALRTPLQAVIVFWSTRLILHAIGEDQMGAYLFAWGFGFLQFLLEFGISSALQRQISERWTQGDREGVDRAIACGMNFYSAMALIQAAVLLALAYWPYIAQRFHGDSYHLIVKLLILQAIMSPFYGLSVVVTSVLQAARRYDFLPRYEVAIVIVRFLILWGGLSAGLNFFWVVVAQTLAQVVLALAPAIWVMRRELGHVPHFAGARRSDYLALFHISFYMFLIQLSVVLADKVDTTILGFALTDPPGPALAVYGFVSKPFLQIRQVGWMLASMVMPAVASLAAAHDERGLDRLKYDGARMHLGLILPLTLLAWIYAAPFLTLWVGGQLAGAGYDTAPWLMRLFLFATVPLMVAIHCQMAIGTNRIAVIALASLAGSLVNLPVSYVLTCKIGVAGVIWGTVLTTFFSNFLVPGIYMWRILEIRPQAYFSRTLAAPLAGAVGLMAAAWACRWLAPIVLRDDSTSLPIRALPLIAHLTVGCLAYLAGYLLVPAGRADLDMLLRKFRLRGS